MTERASKYLLDVLKAIEAINHFVQRVPTYSAYAADTLVRSGVERQLAIIGEAVNQYRREPNSTELTNARQIVQLRNRLVHAYDSVHHPTIWAIVQNYLPALQAEVAFLLAPPE